MEQERTYPQSQITTPAGNGLAVTLSDSVELTEFNREIFVGTGGNLKVTMAANQEDITLYNVPDGSRLPYVVTKVWATGTTASNIVIVW